MRRRRLADSLGTMTAGAALGFTLAGYVVTGLLWPVIGAAALCVIVLALDAGRTTP
jgi:hypothetical protein